MNNLRLQSVQKRDQYAMSIKIQRKQIYNVPILHCKKKNKVSKKIFCSLHNKRPLPLGIPWYVSKGFLCYTLPLYLPWYTLRQPGDFPYT
jgi:hypothetical protein